MSLEAKCWQPVVISCLVGESGEAFFLHGLQNEVRTLYIFLVCLPAVPSSDLFPSSSFVIHFNERMCSYSGDWFSLMQNICTIMCSITCLMNCLCPVCTEWRLTSCLITPQTNNLIYIAVVTHIWLSWTICGLNKCMNLDPPQIQSNPVNSLSCVHLISKVLHIFYSNFVILPEWPQWYTIGCKAHAIKNIVF